MSKYAGLVWIWECFLLFIFFFFPEEFEMDWYSSLNVWYSSPWNHLVLGICWEIFDSWLIFISLVCLDFLFLCDSGLVGCLFLGTHPFLPGYPTCWQVDCSEWSLLILCISVVLVVMSPLISDFESFFKKLVKLRRLSVLSFFLSLSFIDLIYHFSRIFPFFLLCSFFC